MVEGVRSRGNLNVKELGLNFVRDGELLKNLASSLGIHPRTPVLGSVLQIRHSSL